MPAETPQNVGYMIAAYIVTPVILVGYLGALWGRVKRAGGEAVGRSGGQAGGRSGEQAGGRSGGQAGGRSGGQAVRRSDGRA